MRSKAFCPSLSVSQSLSAAIDMSESAAALKSRIARRLALRHADRERRARGDVLLAPLTAVVFGAFRANAHRKALAHQSAGRRYFRPGSSPRGD